MNCQDILISVSALRSVWTEKCFVKKDNKKDNNAQQGALDYDFREKILREMMEGGMNLLESRLPKIHAKSLIIWGANDRIVHVSSVEKFQEGLRNCRTVILEQCGHIPYYEKAEETRRAYRDFLTRINRKSYK